MLPSVHSIEGRQLTVREDECGELAGVQCNPGCQAGDGPDCISQEQCWGLSNAGRICSLGIEAARLHALQPSMLSAAPDVAQVDAEACRLYCGPLRQAKRGMISPRLTAESNGDLRHTCLQGFMVGRF